MDEKWKCTLVINRTRHDVQQFELTGAQIRERFGINPKHDLWQIVPGHPDFKIDDDRVITVGGQRLFSAPRIINSTDSPQDDAERCCRSDGKTISVRVLDPKATHRLDGFDECPSRLMHIGSDTWVCIDCHRTMRWSKVVAEVKEVTNAIV